MRTQLFRILLLVSITVGVAASIVVINQVVQLSQFIGGFNEAAGQVFMVMAFVLITTGLVIPVVLFLKLPAPLIPPKQNEGKAFDKYRTQLARRLSQNPYVPAELRTLNPDGIKPAMEQLDTVVHGVIHRTGKRAFYTTAISQNGALDALFMLGLQFRMIWDIAHVYSQRPTLKDMGFLYTNVMVTALVASQLDEAEYVEMMETAITTGIGSAISLIPGTSIVVNSALSGASNTFLTLRVGIITQRYCNALTRPERVSLRNAATTAAAKQMGSIVSRGTADLARNMISSPAIGLKNRVGDMFSFSKKPQSKNME